MPTIEVLPDAEQLLQQIADALLKSRKVVVITGAGISTNSGIPDFRSENGLYSLIQAQFDAANKLHALEAGETDDLPTVDDRSEPPPPKRRRLSQDTEPTLPSVVVATPATHDATSTIIEGQYSQDEVPSSEESALPPEERPLQDFQAIGDLPTELNFAADVTVNPLESHLLAQPIPDSRPSRPTISSSPLRQALHVSTYATCPGQELAVVPEHGSEPIHDLLHGESNLGPIPCSACTERASGDARRSRAVSMPFNSLRPANTEMYSAPGPRARSASPSRRDCHCRASSTRQPFQRPANSQCSTPRRRGVLGVASPPLSLPHMSSAGLSSARSKASARTPSRFRRGHRGINSSPLSSPPPVLFDPYQESSSSTSHQGSSEAGSAASSESGETPPSSMPSLTSQTSNPSRTSLPNLKGRDLFDVSIWSDPIRTSVFYTFASTLRQKSRDVEPTASHHFISHLRDRGKLVRCYTQNIDQIEEKVGLSTSLQQGPGSRGRFSRKSTGGFSNTSEPTDGKDNARRVDVNNGGVECVFLHGSLQSLRCFLCGQVCEWDEEGRHLETLSGRQPECPHCAGATAARQERGKRALGVGKLRPDIVLYGEEHPNAHLIDPLVKHDLGLYPDFMLILGTSLKVHGLKVIVREFAKAVHSKGGKVVFVNFTKAPESAWGDIIDYWIRWDCDAWVANLQQRIPLLWLPPGTKLPAPPKRKRESSGLEKSSKKRSSGLVKQSSSIVVHYPADTTIAEDAITVLGPAKPGSIPDAGSQVAAAADCTGSAAPTGDVPAVARSSVELMSNEVPPATNQSGALSSERFSTAAPGLSRPEDAPAGYASATFEVRTLTGESTTEAQAVDVPSVPATSTPKTPKAPARPMSLREDKCSGAYLAWQITRDLRRISGNATELATFSSPITRVKPVRTPRSTSKTTPPSSTPRVGAPEQTHTSPSDDSPSIRPPRAGLQEAPVLGEVIRAEPISQAVPREDPIPVEAVQQDTITQQVIQEGSSPVEAVQEYRLTQAIIQEGTTTVEATQKEAVSGVALHASAASEQATQEVSNPGDVVQENSSLQQPVPETFMPEETESSPLSSAASPASALSSPPPTPPSADATTEPVAPSAPIEKAAYAARKHHRKSLPAHPQSSDLRPRRPLRKSLPAPSIATTLAGKPTTSSKSKKKERPHQGKGWVYVRDDDPEVQAIQLRQAMHWGTDENSLQTLPPPANAQTDDGKKKEKPRKGKGWVYVLENDPEAQAIQQRQATYWGTDSSTPIQPSLPADAKPDGSKKKEKPRKGKGWVYVRDDDPEAQAIQQRQAMYWGTETSTRQPLAPPNNDERPATGKQTTKAPKSKGWVYLSEDDPEAQALQMRQAMHWSGANRPRRIDETAHLQQSPAPTPQPLPSTNADLDTDQPAIAPPAKGKRRGKREKGKGWSLLPEDVPEAQELQMRQAKNFGIDLDGDTASAQSIYDALKSNPRHRKRKTIDGVEVALVASGRAPRRSLPAPRAAASLPLDAHATAVFQPLPEPNEILPMPVALASMQKQTWSDKENQSAWSSRVPSDSSLAPMHHLTLAPMRPRPSPLSIQAGVEMPFARPQPLEPLSPPPGPSAAMAPGVGRPEHGHILAPTAFAISDALLYQLRAPPRIWTPEDQLREEAAVLALSSLKTGLR